MVGDLLQVSSKFQSMDKALLCCADRRLPHHVAAAHVAEGPVAEAGVEVACLVHVAGARLAEGDDRSQLSDQPGAPASYLSPLSTLPSADRTAASRKTSTQRACTSAIGRASVCRLTSRSRLRVLTGI